MVKYILKRIVYIVFVLLLVTAFIFALFRSMPTDPVDLFLPPEVQATMHPYVLAITIAEIRETMGLDRSNFAQYFYWLRAIVQGDFGISMETRQPVLDHVSAPMLNTVVLNVISMFFVFLITIPVGIRCAIKRGKTFDKAALVSTIAGISIPGFLFALLLIVVFAVIFPIFPIFGMQPIVPAESGTFQWYLDRLYYMTLPLIALVLMGLPGMIRFIRSAMIDALNMDCVRTARAKGLREKVVIYSHAFRNALIPVITVMAGFFIGIFGGSMAIEITFAWRGMGTIMLTALQLQDIGVLMAVTTFYALISFTVLLLLDVAYTIVDPRIKFD